MPRSLKLLACVLLLLAAVACGSNETPSDTPAATDLDAAPANTAQPCTSSAPPTPNADAEVDMTKKPEIAVPDGAPPCDLVSTDLKEGTGDEATEGANVTVQYVGVAWSTKKQFDSSWDRGEPTPFPLGRVIPGWQKGIPGMKVGGRRQLIIPPDQAYGPQGFPPDIGPNETLVFVIDLLKVG